MVGIKLSICIPTHNFGAFIRDTLDSVIKQAPPTVEIVVLDGASTDNTRQVVSAYQAAYPTVHYYYQPYKGGVDADIARTVELASGEYCWLLSADDALADGALRRIYEEIESGHDIYLCNRILCDRELEPRQPQSWLSEEQGDLDVDLDDDGALSRYFKQASSIGALFSYMSTVVFRRENWKRLEAPAELMGTNYAHVYRLFNMRSFGGKMKYLAAPLVLCRGDNDSFLSLGLAGRHYIDLRGFHLLAEALFQQSAQLRKQFKEVINREHHWVVWVWLRSIVKDQAEWERIRRVLPEYGYGRQVIFAIECLARIPHGVTCSHKLRNLTLRILLRARRIWPA